MLVGTMFAASFLGANALAAPVESTTNPRPGEDGYVHLNHYVTPTELENTYKVELSVSGYADPKPTDVVIILDNSGSMGFDASGTVNLTDNKWKWACRGAKAAIDIFLNPDKNIGADKTRVALVAYGGGQASDRYYFGTQGLRFTSRATGVADRPVAASDALREMASAPTDGFVDMSLKSDLDSTIDAFPYNTLEDTDMKAGLDEADQLFQLARSNHPTNQGAAYDDVRKFIVFLSDGMDTGFSYDTMNVVDSLKQDNVTFMTIGLGLTSETGLYNESKFSSLWNSKMQFSSGLDYWNNYMDLSKFPDPGNYGYFDIPGDQYDCYGASNPEPIQQLIYMGMKLRSTGAYSASYTSWGETDPLWWFGTGGPIPGSINTGVGQILGVVEPNPIPMGLPAGTSPTSGSVAATYNVGNWNGKTPEFMLAYSNADVDAAFQAYANKIIKFGEDVLAYVTIADPFYIYDGYPGMAGWSKFLGSKNQSATRSGRDVTWDVDYIPLTGTNSLIFYIKSDASKMDSDLWYFTSVQAYLTYVDNTYEHPDNPNGAFVKYFAEPLVQGAAASATAPSVEFYAPTQEPATRAQVLAAFPFGSPLPTYTPSVTPRPRTVPVSSVDEGTSEAQTEDLDDTTDTGITDTTDQTDYNTPPVDDPPQDNGSTHTYPPVTGESTNVITIVLLAGLSLIAYVILLKRKSTK